MVIMIGGVSLSTECVDPWVCERASPPLQVGCQLALDVKAVSRLPRLSREPAILLVTWATYASIDDATYLRQRISLAFEKAEMGRLQSSGVTC